jgi:hypothetical protein
MVIHINCNKRHHYRKLISSSIKVHDLLFYTLLYLHICPLNWINIVLLDFCVNHAYFSVNCKWEFYAFWTVYILLSKSHKKEVTSMITVTVWNNCNYSSPWWWRQYAPLKCQSTTLRLHGTISQKALKLQTCHCDNFKSHTTLNMSPLML